MLETPILEKYKMIIIYVLKGRENALNKYYQFQILSRENNSSHHGPLMTLNSGVQGQPELIT